MHSNIIFKPEQIRFEWLVKAYKSVFHLLNQFELLFELLDSVHIRNSLFFKPIVHNGTLRVGLHLDSPFKTLYVKTFLEVAYKSALYSTYYTTKLRCRLHMIKLVEIWKTDFLSYFLVCLFVLAWPSY
jgi:hypothetical protein